MEIVHASLRGGLRATLHAAWLQYRTLRLHPASLLLAVFEQASPLAVWYFVGRFFGGAASGSVRAYGGSYVAYLMVGIALNQIGMAALGAPFAAISEAFWDKRLEVYRTAAHGVVAGALGRVLWNSALAAVTDLLLLALLVLTGLVHLSGSPSLPGLLAAIVLLVGASAGLGAAGASLFFLLEVKSGQDPITWAYRYLVMIVSGLYVPVSLLPVWLRTLGQALPQTYALSAARSALLSAGPAQAHHLGSSIWALFLGAVLLNLVGWPLLRLGLRHAERGTGIGSVV